MKYSIITLFPDMIQTYVNESIIKKAIDRNLIEINVINLREFSKLRHNQIDEYQFGGGRGMVLMPEPIVDAIESVKTPNSIIVLTTPQGKPWEQENAKDFSNNYDHIIIICGHYEGFDERILKYVDREISIGDYVLTGGELPALVMLDSITRLIPNVINQESHEQESFENNLLDYPVYTKPIDFKGDLVPEILLSGHHAKIKKFRDEQQVLTTLKKRPDLINESKLNADQLKFLKKYNSKGEN